MTDKNKGRLSILLMSILFFMNLETPYTHALGDYLLKFFAISPWTQGSKGFHLTIIYFGIPFLISLFFVERICIEKLKYKRSKVFLMFVLSVTLFSFASLMISETIKKSSDGLLSVALNAKDSYMSYRCEDNEYVEFYANFELTNYSKEDRDFYIIINNNYFRENNGEALRIYTYKGEKAKFHLKGKSTKTFEINLDDYIIEGGPRFQNGGGNSAVYEVILENDSGDRVLLSGDNFFGVRINK